MTLVFALFAMAGWCSTHLQKVQHEQDKVTSRAEIEEVLYLPNGEALDLLSFGYRNALAQSLWFQTISYFGKHFQGDRSYRWLSHMCSLVTKLNPDAKHASIFCANMLAWEAKDATSSNAILTAAIDRDPSDWYLQYLRGFNYTYFFKDHEQARNDFVSASKLPGAHPLVIRLAAKKIAELDSKETAEEFLREAIKNTTNPDALSALRSRLRKLETSP